MSIDKGKIVSFNGKFGFIMNKEGQSFYFDDRLFQKDQDTKQIKIDRTVEFESVAAPKGMRAKKIKFIEAQIEIKQNPIKEKRQEHISQKVSGLERGRNFVYVKEGESIDKDHIEACQNVNSGWYRYAGDAKKEIERIAKVYGANYIVFKKLNKSLQYEGNYKYNTHSFDAEIGIYCKKVTFKNEAALKFAQEEIKEAATLFNSKRKNPNVSSYKNNTQNQNKTKTITESLIEAGVSKIFNWITKKK